MNELGGKEMSSCDRVSALAITTTACIYTVYNMTLAISQKGREKAKDEKQNVDENNSLYILKF